MKIVVDWSLCDGNGHCALEAPEHFALDENDALTVIREDVAEGEREAVERAVNICPKAALKLIA